MPSRTTTSIPSILLIVALSCFFLGQLYSFGLHSLGIILLIISSFIRSDSGGKVTFSLPKVRSNGNKRIVWGFSLLFIYILIPSSSCLEFSYWVERFQLKLPLILLPIALLSNKNLNDKLINLFFEILLVLHVVIAGSIWYKYFFASEEMLKLLGQGGSLETPGNHIRYSMSIAIILLINLYHSVFKKSIAFLPKLIKVVLIIILTGLLHWLSIRTGLVLLYAGIGTIIALFILRSKNYFIPGMAVLVLLSSPIIFYQFSDGFKQKIDYMKYDLQQFKNNTGGQYADSGRLVSLIAGWELFQSNPVLGTGLCNLRPLVDQHIKDKYPDYHTNLLPHNQFLFTLTSSGLTGIAFFFLGLWLILKEIVRTKSKLTFILFVVFLVTFMLDHLLEGSIGVGMFTVYLIIAFWLESPKSRGIVV